MSNFEFEDILNMQYPNPEIEKDFPDKILRAAQFAPFAALTGYDEAVIETARLTDSKLELDEYTKEGNKVKYIRATDIYTPFLVGAEAGYLISGVNDPSYDPEKDKGGSNVQV